MATFAFALHLAMSKRIRQIPPGDGIWESANLPRLKISHTPVLWTMNIFCGEDGRNHTRPVMANRREASYTGTNEPSRPGHNEQCRAT
jgi:hypothetical protein